MFRLLRETWSNPASLRECVGRQAVTAPSSVHTDRLIVWLEFGRSEAQCIRNVALEDWICERRGALLATREN